MNEYVWNGVVINLDQVIDMHHPRIEDASRCDHCGRNFPCMTRALAEILKEQGVSKQSDIPRKRIIHDSRSVDLDRIIAEHFEAAEGRCKICDFQHNYPCDVVTLARWAKQQEDYRDALVAFVRAYANTEKLGHDANEVSLFTVWMRATAALGIKPQRVGVFLAENT